MPDACVSGDPSAAVTCPSVHACRWLFLPPPFLRCVAELRLSFLHLPALWLRRLIRGGLVAYFVLGLAFLAVRHGVLPNVPAYRGEIGRAHV